MHDPLTNGSTLFLDDIFDALKFLPRDCLSISRKPSFGGLDGPQYRDDPNCDRCKVQGSLSWSVLLRYLNLLDFGCCRSRRTD